MLVNEIFTSVQGEGYFTGRLSTFVRFTGCNLACPWCDTKYAYSGGTEMTPQEIVGKVKAQPAHCVVLTGGEPLLQNHRELDLLLCLLLNAAKTVQIETNGTIAYDPPIEGVWMTVSPKPPQYQYPAVRPNEIKIVVAPEVTTGLLQKFSHEFPTAQKSLQPLDDGSPEEAWARASILQIQNPLWRLRVQQHKIVGDR